MLVSYGIIGIGSRARKLIGEHFIAPKYSVVGFQLVVDSIVILHSKGARAPSFLLIVGCGYSEISFHFCKDCRIFCEGVKGNGIVEQKPENKYREGAMSTIAAIAKLNALVGRNDVGPIGLIVKINDLQWLVVDSIVILNCEGARAVPITISEGANNAVPAIFCDRSSKFIVASNSEGEMRKAESYFFRINSQLSLIGLTGLGGINDLFGHTDPLILVCLVGLFGLVGQNSLIHNGLVGRNYLVDFIGLVGHHDLIDFIGRNTEADVGFVGLGLVSLGRLISNISLTGFIGLGLIGFIGLGLVSRLIGLIGLISLGLVVCWYHQPRRLVGSSAFGLISRVILLAHHWPHNLVADNRGGTQASSTRSCNNADKCYRYCRRGIYYFASSTLHVHLLVKEKMWWWLALARKKMWLWIASFGKSYNGDVLQLAQQIFSFGLPQTTKYCVMRECENIHSWISLVGDLVFSHQEGEIYGFKFPKRLFGDLFQRSHSFFSLSILII